MLNLALWLKKKLPSGSGADLSADADGAGDDDVPHRAQPAEEAGSAGGELVGAVRPARSQAAQGFPALPRSGKTGRCCARR